MESPATQSCILTINERLSIELTRCHDKTFASHDTAWPTPHIQSLHSWCQSLWQTHAQEGILLSGWQEWNLWQECILQDDQILILNTAKTATMAQQAWQLLHQWNLEQHNLPAFDNPDLGRYLHWSKQVAQRLKQNQWISPATLIREIISLLQSKTIPLAKTIQLVGFDEITPVQHDLIEVLQTQCDVKIQQPPTKPPSHVDIIKCANKQEELEYALSWAWDRAHHHQEKIAIVVPDLANQRHRINHLLQSFDAHYFNVSAGAPLCEYAIIQAAMDALLLSHKTIEVDSAYLWLSSPYLTHNSQEQDTGALIDDKLRQYEQQTLPINTLFRVLPTLTSSHKNSWVNRLRGFIKQVDEAPKRQKPSDWAQTWCRWLTAIGWPGGRGLDTQEYQLWQRFNVLLEEFCQLDRVYDRIPFSSAIKLLQHQLKQTPFQPEGSNAPIQILGMLESAGLTFDQLWVVGLDNQTWPPTARPNPFIPLAVQRQHGLPHSSAERELRYAQAIMQRLLTTAEQVHFSWPSSDTDKALQISPLLAHFKSIQNQGVNLDKIVINKIQPNDNKNNIDHYLNHNTKSMDADQTTPGGSHLFQLQSLCPFKAFAEIRLRAKPLMQPRHGLTPQYRGILVHTILENIWGELKNHQRLLELSDPALTELVRTKIAQVAIPHPVMQNDPKTKWYLELEKRRLENLITQWLDIEKQRGEFSVLAHEQAQQVQIGSLKIRIKMDRIDQLSTGEHIVIDYKTSLTQLGGWFGPRLQAPQLPLYCVYGYPEKPIDGIAYAQLTPYRAQFKGVINEQSQALVPGMMPINQLKGGAHLDWHSLTQQWRNSIEQIGYEFTQGHARVDPATEEVCRYCQLHSLCRIAK